MQRRNYIYVQLTVPFLQDAYFLLHHSWQNTSTGYLTDSKNIDSKTTKFYPYENNLDNVFSKDTRGLKI